MAHIADKLGMGPKRTVEQKGDNVFVVTVVPPAWSKCGDGGSVTLNADQYQRYLSFVTQDVSIEEALPELSKDKREVLSSGITSATWSRIFPDE